MLKQRQRGETETNLIGFYDPFNRALKINFALKPTRRQCCQAPFYWLKGKTYLLFRVSSKHMPINIFLNSQAAIQF